MTSAYFEQIANQWRERARELAHWTMNQLVNRTDVWGRYTGKTDSPFKAVTAPFSRERGKVQLDESSLEKHFKVATGKGLLGVHSTGRGYLSRWLAIDVDRHDEDDLSITFDSNLSAMQFWSEKLRSQGLDPLLFDSNGIGGFHLWVLFEEPMDTTSVHDFGRHLTADYVQRGLDDPPEIFPGSVCHGHFGNWLRLPGRHHSRDHFTRVFNDEPWAETPWLDGHDAIDQILAVTPASVELLETIGIAHKRQTLCLDFDGVIHSYTSGWQGEAAIPDPPIHGVDKAIELLRQRYRVVVHSARSRTAAGRDAMQRWLTKHGIEVDEVCEHKPPATAYIDDRAICFRGNWDDTMDAIREFRK